MADTLVPNEALQLIGMVAMAVIGFQMICVTLSALLAARLSKKKLHPICRLQAKHVAITGGSSGIGFAIAKEALLQGSCVSLIGFDHPELIAAAEQLKSEIGCSPDSINVKVADVRDYGAISTAIEKCWAWRPIDIMVCNAGICHLALAEEHSAEKIENIVGTNLTGTLYTVKAALPLLKQRSQTHPVALVLMGSMASMTPWYGSSVYTSTKQAVKGLAETLKLELLPYNIWVTLVCPNLTMTPLVTKLRAEIRDMRVADKARKSALRVGQYQSAEDVARSTLRAVKGGTFLVHDGQVTGILLSCVCWGSLPSQTLAQALFHVFAFIPAKIMTTFGMLYSYGVLVDYWRSF